MLNALDEMKWHWGRVREGVQERPPRLGGALGGLGACEMRAWGRGTLMAGADVQRP